MGGCPSLHRLCPGKEGAPGGVTGPGLGGLGGTSTWLGTGLGLCRQLSSPGVVRAADSRANFWSLSFTSSCEQEMLCLLNPPCGADKGLPISHEGSFLALQGSGGNHGICPQEKAQLTNVFQISGPSLSPAEGGVCSHVMLDAMKTLRGS